MAPTKALLFAALLGLAALASYAEAQQQGQVKGATFVRKCGITGCKKCNKRGNGQCTRCAKGYVLNAGVCDCAVGYGVCTNPASITGRKRKALPKACPASGLAPKKLYCQKCIKYGGGGGKVTWGPGVAICGAPLTQSLSVAIFTSASEATGCSQQVQDAVLDVFKAGITAQGGTITGTPTITCEAAPPGAPAGSTIVYKVGLSWTGGPSAASVATQLNQDPNPESACNISSTNWCTVYQAGTGGQVIKVDATIPGPPPPPSPAPQPSPTPGQSPTPTPSPGSPPAPPAFS